MDLYETCHLPVAQTPEGDGWEMVSGNATHNSWRRPGPLLMAAMTALDAWHTGQHYGHATYTATEQLETAVHAAQRRET